ncbi:IQ and ubiquitin-like domain-containing [Argiope bruennichi]|uniref:IQ and ubiquitin-like domain-containing n=1 Tax=Argiope bruennichi TaxID=94029 RepID=A0A8T0E5L3_ARGBR|nr:IQ and ubiquitin-like domain-containing [Argiope bruennichi]
MKDKSQQTPKDASTQVQARNIYLSIENDKILETTNNYIYADEIKKEYLNKPYHSKLTDNLIQLANREIDLHIRGIKNVHLEGLQNRIRNLFWQFAKKPVYNPEMQLLTKMKKDDTSSPYIMCCSACKSFYILPINSTDEILGKSVIENYFTKCKKCLNIENEAWIRKDLELYKRILRILISEEEKKSSKSSIIYILRPSDIGYLVEKIWKHQSCLSCSKNDLVIRVNTL